MSVEAVPTVEAFQMMLQDNKKYKWFMQHMHNVARHIKNYLENRPESTLLTFPLFLAYLSHLQEFLSTKLSAKDNYPMLKGGLYHGLKSELTDRDRFNGIRLQDDLSRAAVAVLYPSAMALRQCSLSLFAGRFCEPITDERGLKRSSNVEMIERRDGKHLLHLVNMAKEDEDNSVIKSPSVVTRQKADSHSGDDAAQNNDDDKMASPAQSTKRSLKMPGSSSKKSPRKKPKRNAYAFSLENITAKGNNVERKEVETKLKEMAVFLFQTHSSNKEDATASKSLEFLKSIMSAVKGQEVDLPGLVARSKREDKHTCLANIKPPVIKVDALMDLFKSILAERNKSNFFKIDDGIQFRSILLKDDVGTYMNWTKNFNIADNDEIRKLHTLVVESSMFGTNHAALLYTDVNKMDSDSLVNTAEENKIDKYLLEVLSQILGEFTSSWVSCMDQQEHQPNNKIIFCSKKLHMM